MAYIARQSDSSAIIVQDAATLDRLLPELLPALHSSGENGSGAHSNGNGAFSQVGGNSVRGTWRANRELCLLKKRTAG